MPRPTKYIKWTDAELKFLRENAHRMMDRDIADKLKEITGKEFTEKCVRTTRNRIGIKKAPGRGKCEVTSRRINLADIVGAAAASLHIKGELSQEGLS